MKSHEISRYICYQLIIFPKRLWSMCKNGMVSTTYILFESFVDDYIGTQIFLSNHDVKFYDSFISQVFFFFWKRKNCFFWQVHIGIHFVLLLIQNNFGPVQFILDLSTLFWTKPGAKQVFNVIRGHSTATWTKMENLHTFYPLSRIH